MDKNMISYTFLIFFTITLSECYIVDPGPLVIATKGEVWPKPQLQEKSEDYFVLRPNVFKFEIIGNDCELLQNATKRYEKIIGRESRLTEKSLKHFSHDQHKKHWLFEENYLEYLDTLSVDVSGPCAGKTEWPSMDSDEKYTLNITKTVAQLTSNTVWGALRGLETFSQLIYLGPDSISLRINLTNITDFPRFNHRGLLLDTSRHYIPVEQIYLTLDAMSYNKLNVFHWHITDDQSFPYVSLKFPELSESGAYEATKIYPPSDVQSVIYYARERGIRVLPEFDTPGHTRSWGISHPELLTPCYEDSKPTGQYGPIDPTRNETYTFLEEFFEEISTVFPDHYMHLGGDEVEFECWQSNPNINQFMKDTNITGDYASLESYYVEKIIIMVDKLNSSSIVWEEVFSNGVKLPNETIVHVWKDMYLLTLLEVAKSGRHALLSSCWYLDHLETGGDWKKFYLCDPYAFSLNESLRSLILGGEACMWAESVNEYNVMSRVWPRASAAAEVLWSDVSALNILDAEKRLEEHTCRMNRRGINAQPPNGPGFCP